MLTVENKLCAFFFAKFEDRLHNGEVEVRKMGYFKHYYFVIFSKAKLLCLWGRDTLDILPKEFCLYLVRSQDISHKTDI